MYTWVSGTFNNQRIINVYLQPSPAIPLMVGHLTEMNVISNQEQDYSFLAKIETSQVFINSRMG